MSCALKSIKEDLEYAGIANKMGTVLDKERVREYEEAILLKVKEDYEVEILPHNPFIYFERNGRVSLRYNKAYFEQIDNLENERFTKELLIKENPVVSQVSKIRKDSSVYKESVEAYLGSNKKNVFDGSIDYTKDADFSKDIFDDKAFFEAVKRNVKKKGESKEAIGEYESLKGKISSLLDIKKCK